MEGETRRTGVALTGVKGGRVGDALGGKFLGQDVVAKGQFAIVMLVMCLAIGAAMFLLYERTENSERHIEQISAQHSKERAEQTALLMKMNAESSADRTREHTAIVAAIVAVQGVNEKIGELVEEQNFIVLSDEGERRRMRVKLREPPSLQRKLDRGW